MATSSLDTNSRTKRPLDLARTPNIGQDSSTLPYPTESERPYKKQFSGECSIWHGSDEERPPLSIASQTQGTAPANVPLEQEIEGSNEESLTLEGLRKAPVLARPSIRNTALAGNWDQLHILADLAGKQEYIGTWFRSQESPMSAKIAKTPRRSSRALKTPSPSKTPETKNPESVHTLGEQLMARQTYTPPKSRNSASSSRNSEEDLPQASLPTALGLAPATQGENNIAAENAALAALKISNEEATALYAGFDDKEKEACKILATINEKDKIIARILKQNQKLDHQPGVGPSLSGHLHLKDGKSFDPATAVEEQTKTNPNDTIFEKDYQSFLANIPQDDSDCDTLVEDLIPESSDLAQSSQ
jgi:hypothetical protein